VGENIGMTALAAGTVQQTLSGVAGERTGLPGAETHEPCGEDVCDLVQPFTPGKLTCLNRVLHGDPIRRWLLVIPPQQENQNPETGERVAECKKAILRI
jgi:hypothetical protein